MKIKWLREFIKDNIGNQYPPVSEQCVFMHIEDFKEISKGRKQYGLGYPMIKVCRMRVAPHALAPKGYVTIEHLSKDYFK